LAASGLLTPASGAGRGDRGRTEVPVR